jgi:hypothetical protein
MITMPGPEELRIRLLVCRDCQTIEPLPWYEGPVERDAVLIYSIAPHRTDGNPHAGSLVTVAQASWEDPARRAELLRSLSGGMAVAE